jgi:hypothetical protein
MVLVVGLVLVLEWRPPLLLLPLLHLRQLHST